MNKACLFVEHFVYVKIASRRQKEEYNMTNQEFEQFLSKCSKEVREKQNKLIEAYGMNRYEAYHFEQKTRQLQLKKEGLENLVFEMLPIGSWDYEEEVWEWAWANQNIEAEIRKEVEAVKQLSQKTGFDIFEQEGFKCEEVVARDLAFMAVHELKAIGIYRITVDTNYVFLALTKVIK